MACGLLAPQQPRAYCSSFRCVPGMVGSASRSQYPLSLGGTPRNRNCELSAH